MRIGTLPALVDLLFLIIHEIFYLSTHGTQLNNNMRYHVGIGCSFGASEHSVHEILAKKLDANFINLSHVGLGNFFMLTELSYWIGANKNKIKDTTFSIGCSGIYRNDMITQWDHEKERALSWTNWRADREDDHRGREINGGHTVKHLPDDVDLILDHTVRFLTYVQAIQNLLDSHGCRYVMYNAIDNHVPKNNFSLKHRSRVAVFEKNINTTKFYNIQYSQCQFIGGKKLFKDPTPALVKRKVLNWPTDDNQFAVKDAHPSEEGDKQWAEILWEHCQKNKLL